MSHDPRDDYDRYPHQQGGYHSPYPEDDRYQPRRRRGVTADTAAHITRVVVGLIITIFALHVLFVVLDANQGNWFVSLIYIMAKFFVLGLGDVFTPDDELLGVVLNYALAALIWAILGQLVIKAFRR